MRQTKSLINDDLLIFQNSFIRDQCDEIDTCFKVYAYREQTKKNVKPSQSFFVFEMLR